MNERVYPRGILAVVSPGAGVGKEEKAGFGPY